MDKHIAAVELKKAHRLINHGRDQNREEARQAGRRHQPQAAPEGAPPIAEYRRPD